jgi:hypothetical protein
MNSRIKAYSLPAILTLACSFVFADGDSRKAAPAEQEFSKSTLNVLAKAVLVGPEGWEKTGGSTVSADLKVVYTEVNQPLRLEYHVEWQDSKRMMDAEMQRSQELMKLAKKPGFTGEGVDELQKKLEPRDVKARIDVLTNISSQGIYEKVSPAPAIAGGLAYQSQGEYKSGWREGSTYVFLGSGWKMGTSGGTYINFMPGKKASGSTVVQNLVVKIQADPKRAAQIIQKIDWAALNALLTK